MLQRRARGRGGSSSVQQRTERGQLRHNAATTAQQTRHVGAKETVALTARGPTTSERVCAREREGEGCSFAFCGYRLHGRATGLLRDGEPDREPQQGGGVSEGAE